MLMMRAVTALVYVDIRKSDEPLLLARAEMFVAASAFTRYARSVRAHGVIASDDGVKRRCVTRCIHR